MDFLSVSDLSVINGVANSTGLHKVQFRIGTEKKVVIAGETGSGKTTLLKTIAGLIQPLSGSIYLEGKRVTGPNEQLIPGHAAIAYLSQQYELPIHLRVEQVLEYANTLPELEAQTLFVLCRITHLMKRKTDQLSGGEKQRVALARLLIGRPRLLLLDEPFSNLDKKHTETLKAILEDIGQSTAMRIILTSHEPQDTLSWADTIYVLHQGEIVQEGSPEEIYFHSRDEYTAGLFGSYTLLYNRHAAYFPVLSQPRFNGKKLLVRPQSFKIVAPDKADVKGVVKRVLFLGNVYELEITIADNYLLKTVTLEPGWKTGDTIYVSLPPGPSPL